MSDRERVVGYVNEGVKQDVESHVESTDQSVSAFVASAVREKLQREELERLTDQYSIEQRLLRMIDESTDRVVDQTAQKVTENLLEQLNDEGLINKQATDDGGDGASDWNLE